QGHSIFECPNVKLLEEKYSMLIRALTLKQGKELQEQIDKNFDGPLDDEQIPAALNIILEALKYIITKDNPYNASWYCKKSGKLERIVSEMKSEEFNQGKEKKVEDVYIELREIVDSKGIEIDEDENDTSFDSMGALKSTIKTQEKKASTLMFLMPTMASMNP
ncbi:7472_t:CDS:2, partial [Gigaspora rosea]